MNPKLNPKPRGRHAGLCTLVGVFAFLGMCAFIIFQMRSIGLEHRRAEAAKKAAAGPQASLTLTFGFSDGAQYLCEQDGGAAFTADFSDPLACGGILSDEDLVSITYSYPESSEPDTLYYRVPTIYRYDGTPSELSPAGSDWLVVTGVDTSATANFGYSVSISYTLPGGDLPRAFALVTPDETISADAVTNTGGYNAPYSSGTARFTVYAESDAALDTLLAASTLTAERWQPIDACGAAVTCSLADVRLVAAGGAS